MTNRKIDYCLRCGRPEKIGAEMELVMCSVCALLRAERLNRQPRKDITGEDVKKRRESRRMSLRKLARELRLTPQYLSMVENGKKAVSSKVYTWYAEHGC